jgi:hypothetical protein
MEIEKGRIVRMEVCAKSGNASASKLFYFEHDAGRIGIVEDWRPALVVRVAHEMVKGRGRSVPSILRFT